MAEPAAGALDDALAHLRAGHPERAEALVRGVLASRPKDPDGLHLLGMIASLTGHGADALGLIRRALTARPGDPDFLFSLGNALRAEGDRPAAVEAFQQALAARPDFAEAAINLGLTLEAEDRLDEAQAALTRCAALAPQAYEPYLALGNLEQERYCFAAAVTAYRSALALRPDLPELHSNMGNALRGQGDLAAAQAAFEAALARAPDFAQARFNQGVALLDAGKLDAAVAFYGDLLALQPDHAEARFNLACALRDSKRYREAEAALRQVLELEPAHESALVALAVERLRDGDAVAALDLCRGFRKHHPGNTAMLGLEALATQQSGDTASARTLSDFGRLVRPLGFEKAPGYGSLPAFHEALIGHVERHPSLTFEPAGLATFKGRQTSSLVDPTAAPMAAFAAMIAQAVASYRAALPPDPAHPYLARRPARWRLRIWAVLLQPGGHQRAHIHPAAWLSGVYYARLPESLRRDSGDRAGWLEFGRPGPDFPLSVAPLTHRVRPTEGLMVLFPAYLYHRTLPFTGDAARISLAFDVIPRP